MSLLIVYAIFFFSKLVAVRACMTGNINILKINSEEFSLSVSYLQINISARQ